MILFHSLCLQNDEEEEIDALKSGISQKLFHLLEVFW